MQSEKDIVSCEMSFCPSFSSYSGDRLADTADRVCRNLVAAPDDCREQNDAVYGGREDEEFEFVILCPVLPAADSSTDGGFLFPVFDRNLVSQNGVYEVDLDRDGHGDDVAPAVATPLRELFLRDRNEGPPSPSSSEDEEEADELDGVPSEIYCAWTPERSAAEMSPRGGCKKSRSTGSSSSSSAWSSKRWRIKDLLKRSHSDGKQSLIFLNSNSMKNKDTKDQNDGNDRTKQIRDESKKKEKVSAHEVYLKNKATTKEGDKRRSYLPYRQDLVGLFSTMNGLGKTFHPF